MSLFLRPASRIAKSISSVPTLKTPKWLAYNSFSTYEEALLNIPPTRSSVLDSGLRVATEDTGSKTATVGLWMYTGPRFETNENNGITHFLEHMAFKGTKKRSQTDLELEVENLGAQLNAYTTRELSVLYAKCLSQDVPKLVEILSDIVQNNKFGDPEIEKEREVILHKIEAETNLRDVVFDHLHSVAFQGTPLARTILGPTQIIKSLNKQDFLDYINLHYKAPRIVFAGAGGIEHDTMVLLAEEHFKGLTWELDVPVPEMNFCRFTGSDVRVRDDDIPLAHIAIAFEGVGWSDPDRIPLMVASTLLGSWDRTHGGGVHNAYRLAQAGVEGNLCHAYEAFNINYKDTGLWGIYFECDRLTIDDFVFNLQCQLMHICTSVSELDVERAKNTLRSKLLLNLDGTTPISDDIGKQILYNGRRIPFHELDAKIEAVNADILRDTCYRHLYDRCPAIAAVGPVEQLPDYNRIRSGMYWLRV
ncbi:UNVERIFIED_CONTAM: hypothetical protein RMT77_009560 [Armadillidium vulgare]